MLISTFHRFRLQILVLLLIFVAVVLISISLIIGRFDIEKQQGKKRLAAVSELATIGNRLEGEVRSTFNLTQGIVHLIRFQGYISKGQFEALCSMSMSENSNIRNVALAPGNVVQMVYPLHNNEQAIGLDYMKNDEQRNSVLRAMKLKQPLLAGPVNLVQGGVGIINRSPIYVKSRADSSLEYWGMASIVAYYDSLLHNAGLCTSTKMKYALQGEDGKGASGKIFFGDSAILGQNPVYTNVVIPGGSWRLLAVPVNGWGLNAIYQSPYFLFSLMLTFFILLMLTILLYKNENIRKKNIELGQEIAERKVIEIELQQSKEAAEEANRVKTAFLANMSHEIRTPMNAIQGFTEILLKNDFSEKLTLEYAEIINISSKQLLNVINDIIDISMIESGQLKIINEKVALNLLLNDIYRLHYNVAAKKNIALKLNPGLRDGFDTILSDEHRLSQVINNLVSNALKFTFEGYVEFGYTIDNKMIKFFVKDSGVGIPQAYHKAIFERFKQVDDRLSRSYGGTGLGLSICKSIVEMMDGKIYVESEPKVGSLFYFTLPYVYGIQRTSSKIQPVDNDLNLKGKKILIAEDDNINFRLLEALIKKTNAKILRASNGREVIEIVEREKGIDLVLMDIKMPVMNGYEAIRLIRQMSCSIPIIAQTAYAMGDEVKIAMDAGCNYYITKPINHGELFGIFQQIFNR